MNKRGIEQDGSELDFAQQGGVAANVERPAGGRSGAISGRSEAAATAAAERDIPLLFNLQDFSLL